MQVNKELDPNIRERKRTLINVISADRADAFTLAANSFTFGYFSTFEDTPDLLQKVNGYTAIAAGAIAVAAFGRSLFHKAQLRRLSEQPPLA